jgi:hypothetical protein
VPSRFAPPSGTALSLLLGGTALLARSELTHGWLVGVIDGADLVFHEAGHPILGLLGSRALMFLGGTVGQLAFPTAAAVAFVRRGQLVPLAVALLWMGVNLADIGRYMADAEARALPLLTGEPASHDWWNLLGFVGLRAQGPLLGGMVRWSGYALQALAPTFVAFRWVEWRLGPPGRS